MNKERSLVPVIVGVALVGLALVVGGGWFLWSFLSKQVNESSFRVRPRTQGGTLMDRERGPLYPGALPAEVDPNDKIGVEVPLHGDYEVITGVYETDDGLDQAVAYYRHYFAGRAAEHVDANSARWVWNNYRGYQIVELHEGKDRLRIRIAVVFDE